MHWIRDRQECLGLNKRFLYFNMILPATRLQHSLKEWGSVVAYKTWRSHGLGNSPVSGISIYFLSIEFSAPVHRLNTAMRKTFIIYWHCLADTSSLHMTENLELASTDIPKPEALQLIQRTYTPKLILDKSKTTLAQCPVVTFFLG